MSIKDRKEFSRWLKQKGIIEFIHEEYEAYYDKRYRKEPCITASYIRDFILDGEMGSKYRKILYWMTDRQQITIIHNALESLRKQGLIGSSYGVVKGKEVRCYEPINT
jgi:hypothetical protein